MYRTTVDLNCDMGESFGRWAHEGASDSELMPIVSSANVAAGFHAGDPNRMDAAAQLAAEHGVSLGAHPGYHDLQGFGRRGIAARPDELVNDMLYQVGALREFGRRHGAPLRHVKPHGALYMAAAEDATLSSLLVEALRKTDPELRLYCMDVSKTCEIAEAIGQPVVREFFADRDYDGSGSIVFAREMRPLDPMEVAEKCLRACAEGKVRTTEGKDVEIPFDSICFHSDTPGALRIGVAIRELLTANGVAISAPGAEGT